MSDSRDWHVDVNSYIRYENILFRTWRQYVFGALIRLYYHSNSEWILDIKHSLRRRAIFRALKELREHKALTDDETCTIFWSTSANMRNYISEIGARYSNEVCQGLLRARPSCSTTMSPSMLRSIIIYWAHRANSPISHAESMLNNYFIKIL